MKLHTKYLIISFKQDNSNKQGRAIELLNEKLLEGKLSNKNISDTFEIIIDHIGARTRATRENYNTMPRIWMYEIQFGWNSVKDNLVSENQKIQFLHDTIAPQCNNSYIQSADIHRFELNSKTYIPKE
jgi:hypothetical protein